MGALCSILLIIILLTYTGYKIYILQGKQSIDIVQAVRENKFDDTRVFGAQQGLNFAVAVSNAYDPTLKSSFIDPSYGKIVVLKTEWGRKQDGTEY